MQQGLSYGKRTVALFMQKMLIVLWLFDRQHKNMTYMLKTYHYLLELKLHKIKMDIVEKEGNVNVFFKSAVEKDDYSTFYGTVIDDDGRNSRYICSELCRGESSIRRFFGEFL